MTNTKHTPSGWKYKKDEGTYFCEIFDSQLTGVCTLGDIRPENEQHARLISAAPNLLESLSILADWLDAIKSTQSNNLRGDIEVRVRTARAAIAKAKGE